MTRQNDDGCHPGPNAERHIRCACGQQARRPSGDLGHAANRRSGIPVSRGRRVRSPDE